MKTIRLDGVVGYEILAENIAPQLEGQSEIKLILNSGGGSIIEGFSIYNLLKDFSGRIEAHIDFAGSMMSLIAMVADHRVMKRDSSLMMTHRPLGGAMGRSEDLREHADTLDQMEGMVTRIYAEATGMSTDEMAAHLADERYMDAEECLALGFIDEIDSGSVDMSLVAMAGMKAHEKVGFSLQMFTSKLEAMKNPNKPIKNIFSSAQSMADVEAVARNEFKLSRAQTTAIVSAVKKIVLGDQEADNIKNLFENLTKSN